MMVLGLMRCRPEKKRAGPSSIFQSLDQAWNKMEIETKEY
jgi:hypothetical protein